VNELLAGLLAAPLLAHGAQLLLGRLSGVPAFASSRGALAMLSGPALFGIGLLWLTRMYWAAWAAWAVELLLLGLTGAGDVVATHAPPLRLAVTVVVLPVLAWRIAGLQKLQRLTPASRGP
jgi:hypothetical protein